MSNGYNSEFKAWRLMMDLETNKAKTGESVVKRVSRTIKNATNPVLKDAWKEGNGNYIVY